VHDERLLEVLKRIAAVIGGFFQRLRVRQDIEATAFVTASAGLVNADFSDLRTTSPAVVPAVVLTMRHVSASRTIATWVDRWP
jgi:hypothetical protein